jgi:hypothetical protein
MANENDLRAEARRLQREIARLDRAIAQGAAYNDKEDRREQLERLRTVRGLRERELNDIQGQIAAKG